MLSHLSLKSGEVVAGAVEQISLQPAVFLCALSLRCAYKNITARVVNFASIWFLCVKVNIVLNIHRNLRLIRDGEKGGKGVRRWGKREIIYLSLQCHHQNGSCIKMGSNESHFNVLVGNDRQSHKTVSTNHNLFEEKGEPKQSQTEVLPLTSLMPYC